MLTIALKNMVAHKFRSLALILTVVLGVSFVTGTYVLTDTVTNVFNDIFADVYKRVDVNVRTESALGTDAVRRPLPQDFLTTVKSIDGVAVADGSVFGDGVDIIGKDGKRLGIQMAPALATNWGSDELTPLNLRTGRQPADSNEVAIDAKSFTDGGFQVGDQVTIVTAAGPRPFTLVGSAGFGRASNIAGATLAVFDTATAQQVMNRVGMFDSINLKATDGVSADILQERVSQALPPGFEAVTSSQLTSESDQAINEALGFFKTFLLLFAFVALFVGAFIIYNTFGIVVSQRTRELALLRALGATGTQVMVSVIVEALILGTLASILGLGAGVIIAAGLKALLAGLGFDVPSGSLVVLPRTVLVAMTGGVAITVVSAIAPGLRAARVPPIAAMQDVAVSHRAAGIRRNVAGVVALVVGVLLTLRGLSNGVLSFVGLGALLTFLGVAMLAPLFARPVAGFVGKPVAYTRGASGQMARQNAMRSARRTATTASALMIGTALMAGALILSGSMTRSVDRAVTKGAVAELVIRSDTQQAFSPAIAEEIANIDGLRAVQPYQIGRFKIGQATKEITAVATDALDPHSPNAVLDVDLRKGDISQLRGDNIAIDERVARDHHWDIGQTISITTPSGPANLRLAALYSQNALTGDYIVGLDTFRSYFAERNHFLVLLRLDAGADLQQVQRRVQDQIAPRYPSIKVQDRDQYIGDVKAQVNQFLSLITALLALAVIIALIGVLITMLLAVFERTREIGLLRSVGMARRQIRSMVRWEAAIVAIYGALLGTVLGVFFGLALTSALRNDGVTDQVVPVPTLAVLMITITSLGVAAAIYPARRAARLNILTAISHE